MELYSLLDAVPKNIARPLWQNIPAAKAR